MALQKINWTQIDTLHIPTGHTVDIGQFGTGTSVNSVNTNELSILGVDFFDWLMGYTGGTPNDISVVDNAGLSVESSLSGKILSTTYNTTLDPALATPSTVGGITAGTTVAALSGKTFVQFVDDLLFPIVLPTYTIPTITMTGISSGIREIGSTISATLSVYGDKNDAGAYSQLRVLRNGLLLQTDTTLTPTPITNIAPQFGYADPNNPNYRYTIPTPYSESYVIPYGSYPGTTTYRGDGNYGAGVAKQNNKGSFDVRTPAVRSGNAPQASSANFDSDVATTTNIFPYFYGTSATLPTASSVAALIAAGSGTKVVQSASGTLSIPYNVGLPGLYIWFAYFSSYTTKTKWWVNDFDAGSIDGSFISPAVTQAVTSPESYWTTINFKIHWSVYLTVQNTIEFRNT